MFTLGTLVRLKAVWILVLLVATLSLPMAAHAQAGGYVVQPGDTLYSIAIRQGTTVQALMAANGIANPNLVYAGQRLAIPGAGGATAAGGGGVHVVQWGHTLSAIAARYGTSVAALMQANGLASADMIYAGQRLSLPGGGGGSTRGGGAAPAAGTVHVVRAGETLSSIAARYGTTVPALAAANGIANPNLVYVGQRLNVAGGGGGGAAPATGTAGGGGRWIEVDLGDQRVMAREGSAVVRTMVVSTGVARYPTPTGTFRIYAKYASVTMSGPGYYLPGVPHSMFFYRGYALHGTYWHNNFGRPMSHGCVNLTRTDAAWLYAWAPSGTVVEIHW